MIKRTLMLGLMVCFMLAGVVASGSAQTIDVQKKEFQSQKKESVSSKNGWLGVSIQDITSEMKKAMDLKSREGALVSEVVKKSPADSAGIKEKDIIVQFGGQSISDASELQKAVADAKPGTKVAVVVLRKGEKKTIDVVVGKQANKRSIFISSPRGGNHFEVFTRGRSMQGMALRQLNEQLSKYFEVPEGTGVLVWEVEKGSAAEKAGINAGDVITVIGKKKIKELRDVSRALGIYDEGEKAEIEIVRKGARKTVSLEVEEGNDGEGYNYWFNEMPFKNRNERMLFNMPEIDVQVPEIDETVHPDFDQLKIELNELRKHLKDQSTQLREKIEREVKPRITVSIGRSI